MDLESLLKISPYSLSKTEKTQVLNVQLNSLFRYHYQNCSDYRRMMDAIGYELNADYDYTHLPFLPVRLFKMLDLLSIEKHEVFKTMNSSGTTGQQVSRIYLDKETSTNQTKALVKIVSSYVGNQRLPMVILDSEETIKNRNLFSARGAGILGFSIFANKKIFALNEKMEINLEMLYKFISENSNQKFFLFGFTFMIWQHFYKELKNKGIKLDLSNSVMFHGGGWKKLSNEAISTADFKKAINNLTGISEVHDYYGMVEQTGSVYVECECGFLHAPVFSDIIIRRARDFSIADFGEPGLIQVLSVLPKSYPGHSLLTEDEGVVLGEDNCKCGRLGKYFRILGRIKSAEIRGCSDVYTQRN